MKKTLGLILFFLLLFFSGLFIFLTKFPYQQKPVFAQTCQDNDGICPEGCASETDSDCTPSVVILPTSTVDSNEIFLTSPDGQLGQTITKGRKWWYRPDIKVNDWPYAGVLFEGETCSGSGCNNPFPETIDSMAVWSGDDGRVVQLVTSGDKFWYRPDTSITVWTSSGTLFEGESCAGSGCVGFPPSGSIDSMTVFPHGDNFAQIVTKNGRYWYRLGLSKDDPWSSSDNLFSGEVCRDCEFPAGGIGSFSTFLLNGKLAQLATKDNTFWYRSDSAIAWIAGEIVPSLVVDYTKAEFDISPYIYGVNLIWHSPHTRYYDDSSSAKDLMREALITLSPSMVRFPGGCGGDSYAFDWGNIQATNPGIEGMTKDDYIDLFQSTGIEPFYTVNIEGEGTGYVNNGDNCHELKDYGGTASEALDIINYFSSQGVLIKHVEVANEPWAPEDSGCSNWQETWDLNEYLVAYDNLVDNLDENIKVIIAADGNWARNIDYQNHRINYVQSHPYSSGEPLLQVDRAEEKLKELRSVAPADVGIAVTEYNLPCWTGVFCNNQESEPHEACGTVSHAFYLAKMLGMFIRENVDYAMIWHLFEDKEKGSDWECGLVEYDGTEMIKTPSFHVFKLVSESIRGGYIPTVFSDDDLYIISSKSDEKAEINILIVNPDGVEKDLRINMPGVVNDNLILKSRVGDSLGGAAFSFETNTFEKTLLDEGYEILLPRYSVSVATIGVCRNGDGICPQGCTLENDNDCIIEGDLNNDGLVNSADIKILLSRYGTDDSEADLNSDSIVNGMDFGEMVRLIQ